MYPYHNRLVEWEKKNPRPAATERGTYRGDTI